MKVLDRYILFTFVKTFLSIFTILMFIFLLQSVWLYIQELSGRDLDFPVILKFLLLASPSLVVLVLPLSILLTSIMTFGSFSENYEFAAMKSTGISLQRAMGSVIVFVLFIGITSFLFANHVIPASQYEFRNLRRNIAKLKPAMALREGQFNEMGENYNIKISDKFGERDQFLTDVIIHKKDPKRIGNYTVIKAREGELISSENEPVLSLQLKEGNYYDEVYQKDIKKKKKEPFVKSYFDTYTINIDLSELDNVDLDEKEIDNSYQMLNVTALDSNLNKLSIDFNKNIRNFGRSIVTKNNLTALEVSFEIEEKDSIKPVLLDNYTTREKSQILTTALSSVKNNIISINNRKITRAIDVKRINKFEIAIHEKYVLGFSCIILFFVGAPLGAIIRKGGLGLPIVIGVVFFLAFHFIGIFAKNSAEDGSVSAALASWLNVLLVFPLGVYFTYRATTDQGLFDWDWVHTIINKLGLKKKENNSVAPEETVEYTLTSDEKTLIEARSINQLKDIVKNYRQYNYSEAIRYGAIDKLQELGISKENLKVQGFYENTTYSNAKKYSKSYFKLSKITLLAYVLTLILIILPAFFDQSPKTGINIIIQWIGLISLIAFYVLFAISIYFILKYYHTIGEKQNTGLILLFWLGGIIGFIAVYFYFKNKIKEEIVMIR